MDRDGDTCSSYYDLNNEDCGLYDTPLFVASEACCNCKENVPMTTFPEYYFRQKDTKCQGDLVQTYIDNSVFDGSEKLFIMTEAFKRESCYMQCVAWDDIYKDYFNN